jgi:hypothetical protein
MLIAVNIGCVDVIISNINVWCFTGNIPYWFTRWITTEGIRSYSPGGYWRQATDTSQENSTMRGNNNNFRYYDDLYVDTTWSRVMLCKIDAVEKSYANATICEPQIPVTWASSSIDVTVNQGALPDGTAYLFVFDSDNNANSPGYPVTLGTMPSAQVAIGGGAQSITVGGGSLGLTVGP